MVGGIGPEGVHEDIDVGKVHGLFMTSSKSLDRLSIPRKSGTSGLQPSCRRMLY